MREPCIELLRGPALALVLTTNPFPDITITAEVVVGGGGGPRHQYSMTFDATLSLYVFSSSAEDTSKVQTERPESSGIQALLTYLPGYLAYFQAVSSRHRATLKKHLNDASESLQRGVNN
jgi:hypothetical protein